MHEELLRYAELSENEKDFAMKVPIWVGERAAMAQILISWKCEEITAPATLYTPEKMPKELFGISRKREKYLSNFLRSNQTGLKRCSYFYLFNYEKARSKQKQDGDTC